MMWAHKFPSAQVKSLVQSIWSSSLFKLNNKDYNKMINNKISPEGPYNEETIIKLNFVCEDAKNKDKKEVSLTSHIEERSWQKKNTYMAQ